MDVYVPFDAIDPKRRLESILTADERGAFAEAMLADVLEAVRGADATPHVLSTAPMALDAPVIVDERGLTRAVNGLLDLADRPVVLVMADLPLATDEAIATLTSAAGDVVAAPGIGGGTNALAVHVEDFEVDFHGCSIEDHRRRAVDAGHDFRTVDRYTLGIDIDEPDDLAEVLLHADGDAAGWLREHGFDVVADTDGRVGVERAPGD